MRYIICLLLFALASCSSPTKLLCRTWKIDDVQFKDSLNTLTQSQKDLVSKSLKSDLLFTFKVDSTYLVRNAGNTTTSKWWFTGNKKVNTLYTQGDDGKIVKSKIYKVTKTYLQFESEGQEKQSFLFTCSPTKDSK